MEKILWVRSAGKMLGSKENDGLAVVNKYLEDGWKVKFISACSLGENITYGQAYVVIEKNTD